MSVTRSQHDSAVSGANIVMTKSAHAFSESDDDLRPYEPSKGCCELDNRPLCCLHALIFLFCLVLFVIGFCSPYWVWLKEDGVVDISKREEIRGLWLKCTKEWYHNDTNSGWDCSKVEIGDRGEWYKSIGLVMIAGLFAMLVSLCTLMLMPITAVCQMVAGVLGLIVAIVYALKAELKDHLHWSFYVAVVSAGLVLLNGLTLAFIQRQRDCVVRPTWPCRCCRNNKVDDDYQEGSSCCCCCGSNEDGYDMGAESTTL